MKDIIFWVCTGAVFIAMLTLLELNKNTVWGTVLTTGITAGFCYLRGCHEYAEAGGLYRTALFLGWIALFAAILFLTWPPVRPVPAADLKKPEKTDVITLSQGSLRGVYNKDKSVEVFAGIPYAKPPVGELRWKAPQDAESWEGVFSADRFAPMSMQKTGSPIMESLKHIVGYHDYRIRLDDSYSAPVSEDSLYLNIWKPAGSRNGLPVLVFIHGGSLQNGQTWFAGYNGESLAREGVIVVNMGYRLGVFGYFADGELLAEDGTTGNYGLLDQIKALEWVRDNITAFGGDPDNVTLSGESAGAVCVSALCVSPLAKGLFRRAVLESSTVASAKPPHSFRTLEEALESGRKTKERLRCRTAEQLRALPAKKLVSQADIHHHITVDGYVLAELPYESYLKGLHNEEAVLHGYNSEESGPFIMFSRANMKNYCKKMKAEYGENAEEIMAMYPVSDDGEADRNWAKVYGAEFFDYAHYCLNRLAAENGIPVYEYVFSKHNGGLGAWHSGEMIYCFGNIPADSKRYNGRDRELSREMKEYWKNFIFSGDPNGEGLPIWQRNTSSSDIMSFSDSTGMTNEENHDLFAVFDRITGWKGQGE